MKSWLLIGLALVGSATSGTSWTRDGDEVQALVLNRVLRSLGGTQEDQTGLEPDLVGMGPSAAPVLLGLLDRAAFLARRSDGTLARLQLDEAHLDAISGALGRMSGGALRSHLRSVAAELDDGQRIQALLLLGERADPSALADMEFLALSSTAGLTPSVRTAFETGLAELASQDRGLVRNLSQRYPASDPRLRASYPRALGLLGGEEALSALAGMMLHHRDLHGLVLTQLGTVGEALPKPVDSSASRVTVAHLSDARMEVRLAAVFAAEGLAETTAIAALIKCLDDEQAIATAAMRALRRATGSRLRAAPEAWRGWLREQEAWWASEAPGFFDDLAGHGDAVSMARAINELSRRSWFRHEIATELAHALPNLELEHAGMACAALARLGSANGAPALRDAMQHPDADLSAAAAAALAKLEHRVPSPPRTRPR